MEKKTYDKWVSKITLLLEKNKGKMNIMEIVVKLNATLPTVSKYLDIMEANKLVKSAKLNNYRREVTLLKKVVKEAKNGIKKK